MNKLWPDLPINGFIVGRVATADDVRNGDAVFHTNGTGGEAADIIVPQYAYWSEDGDALIPVILVQAEHASQETTIVVGIRDLAGQNIIATIEELELLGEIKPN